MARRAERGFTLIELVTVMILLGILAFVALPNLNQAEGFRATSFNDRVAASLRFAQKSAVAHRRLVCATVAADQLSLSLTIATAFGDLACPNALAGPDGANPAAASPAANVTLTVAPAGVVYFQPSGAATSDAAGTIPANFTVTVSGQTPFTVNGATGYVD